MNSKEISLWLDERWCNALEQQHGGKPVEDLLAEYVQNLIAQLPDEKYDAIEREIRQENSQQEAETEARRRFSLARVTENGTTRAYLTEGGEDVLQTAYRVRHHLRNEGIADLSYKGATPLDELEADRYTAELIRGSDRIMGVYDIDLDRGEMSVLDANDGWHTWSLKDVSTAAYYANKEMHTEWTRRIDRFNDRLEGKEISGGDVPLLVRGEQPLPADGLTFEDEICEMDNRLNFYIPVWFDPDAVFGTNVGTDENDDWINVYANYDLERGCVCDTLEICLVRNDGPELACEYRLAPEERIALASKMDAYCRERLGIGLEEAQAQYLEEESGMQMGGVE